MKTWSGQADDLAPIKAAPTRTPVPTNRLLGQDTARIYFATDPLVSKQQEIKPWAPGYAPVVTGRRTPAAKRIANKGEVTGVDRVRSRRPSGSACRATPAPRRRSVSPTRSISKRAANRCAGRSRSPRW